MPLEIEDHFPGTPLEDLPTDLDLGDEVVEDADDLPNDDAPAGDDGGSDDADAPASDDDADGADDESGDADADGDDSGEPAESEEPAPTKPEKSPVIPKARLDQELRKRRVAEQRAQELATELAELRKAQLEAARPKPLSGDEIKAKMAEANEALIGGDTTRAAEIQAELLAALAAPAPLEAPGTPVERDLVAEVEARIEFKHTLERVNERFPELDENSEHFNEELSQEAVDLQRVYIERGYTLADATRKAAEGVAKLHDLQDRVAKPAADPKVVATQARQRQKTQQKIEKAVAAPPSLTGRVDDGKDVAFDVYKASEDELMALPQAALDRLLGNSL